MGIGGRHSRPRAWCVQEALDGVSCVCWTGVQGADGKAGGEGGAERPGLSLVFSPRQIRAPEQGCKLCVS